VIHHIVTLQQVIEAEMRTVATLYRSLPMLQRRTRRLLVLLTGLGYPLVLAGYGTLVAPGRISLAAWAPVATVLMAFTVIGVVAIFGYARGRADLGSGRLDERQAQLRDRAWALSYAIVIIAIALVLVSLMVVRSSSGMDVALSGELIGYAATTAAIYLPVLPPAVLAWMEPDAPRDETIEASGAR
jgi:hypothetical protein